MTAVGEIFRIKALLNDQITQRTRELLETKHLYQQINLELSALVERETKTLDHQMKVSVGSAVRTSIAQAWFASVTPVAVDEDLPTPLTLSVQTVKLFCAKCERVEAFRAIFIADVLRPTFGLYSHVKHPATATAQTFVLSFSCQSCGESAIPDVLLIQRRGEHLQLCGRSPMEQLPAVEGIPKEDQKLLSSARIARNSGQALAGIALIRCFLEQFARRDTKSTEWGDRLMATYHASLPPEFPSQFRTFVSLYSDLSAALHSASESTDVFDASLERIVEHFTARKLYRVSPGARTGAS